MHHTSRTIRRVIVTTVTSAALVASAMVAPGMGTAASLAGQDQASKIEPALAATLAHGQSEFWVRFAASADLAAASAID